MSQKDKQKQTKVKIKKNTIQSFQQNKQQLVTQNVNKETNKQLAMHHANPSEEAILCFRHLITQTSKLLSLGKYKIMNS